MHSDALWGIAKEKGIPTAQEYKNDTNIYLMNYKGNVSEPELHADVDILKLWLWKVTCRKPTKC